MRGREILSDSFLIISRRHKHRTHIGRRKRLAWQAAEWAQMTKAAEVMLYDGDASNNIRNIMECSVYSTSSGLSFLRPFLVPWFCTYLWWINCSIHMGNNCIIDHRNDIYKEASCIWVVITKLRVRIQNLNFRVFPKFPFLFRISRIARKFRTNIRLPSHSGL